MSAKLILLALLIRAPLLSNATPFWTPATVTQTVFQYPIASSSSALVSSSSVSVSVSSNPLPPNIGTGIASITPQLEYPLRDLRQLDSLFTSVTDTLRNAVNNLVSELNQVTDQVDMTVSTASLATFAAAQLRRHPQAKFTTQARVSSDGLPNLQQRSTPLPARSKSAQPNPTTWLHWRKLSITWKKSSGSLSPVLRPSVVRRRKGMI
ncbi:hypothetical protein B0H14DRAFT_936565 [Mycena olivaceomarginata]|nr:hypothetical protein B0H14DRAFT_936565 [Mycena olivaceomarginata]